MSRVAQVQQGSQLTCCLTAACVQAQLGTPLALAPTYSTCGCRRLSAAIMRLCLPVRWELRSSGSLRRDT
jgi:hypothetical protein